MLFLFSKLGKKKNVIKYENILIPANSWITKEMMLKYKKGYLYQVCTFSTVGQKQS